MKKIFKGKKVTVVGLAKSGIAAALLLKKSGAEVWATDSADSESLRKAKDLLESKGIKTEIGRHTVEFIKGKSLLVVSPGVPENSPAFKSAAKYKIPVIGEIELGYLCCGSPIIAVTGTNGKSTTTTLIGEILKKGGKRVVVCGNIGNPFCAEIDKIKKNSIVVLEVSSFQLESIKLFRPHVAVALNVSQNHFDRHPDLQAYVRAKSRIFENQKKNDWAVLNHDDPIVERFKAKTKAKVVFFSRKDKKAASYFEGGSLFISEAGKAQKICDASELKIKGTHNIENVLACLCVAHIFGITPKKIKEALVGFKGLEHRFEHVTVVRGVEFINDSKATTVLAAVMAIESCHKPVILIAGGHDKGSDFRKARHAIGAKVKKLVLIGEAKEKLKKHLKGAAPYIFAKTMEEAVKKAFIEASEGDCVLLSPMCASFDMFRNFEERGRVFKEIIRDLKLRG